MGWKKLAIIYLLILFDIEARSIGQNPNGKLTCSHKRVSCLNDTSFKFCFSAGPITYSYGEVKHCPSGTVCSEYEGIEACIESIDYNGNSIKVTAYSTISPEYTISSPLTETITEGQITETTVMMKWPFFATLDYMMQSRYSSTVTETTPPVEAAQSSHNEFELPTEQYNISETMKPMASSVLETPCGDLLCDQSSSDTPEFTVTANILGTFSTELPTHQSLLDPITEFRTDVFTSSRYSTGQYQIKSTKPATTVTENRKESTSSKQGKNPVHSLVTSQPSITYTSVMNSSHKPTKSTEETPTKSPFTEFKIDTPSSSETNTSEDFTSIIVVTTDQAIQSTRKSMTSDMLDTTSENSSYQYIITTNSPTILGYSSKTTKRRRKSTTLPLITHNHSTKVRKRKRKSTTPLSTTRSSSKVTRRRREPTTPSSATHYYSSKVTKRRRKSTTSALPTLYHSSKVTTPTTSTSMLNLRSKLTNSPISTITVPSKIIASYETPQSLSSSPSYETSTELPPTAYTMKISSELSTVSASSSAATSKNFVNEATSLSIISNHGFSTLTSTTSSRIGIGNQSTGPGYLAPLDKQSTTTTLFPCQNYLLRIISRATPDPEAALVTLANHVRTTEVSETHEIVQKDVTPPSACTSSGKYPSKKCHEYYECLKVMWWYRLMFRKCSRNERFDNETSQCVPDNTCN